MTVSGYRKEFTKPSLSIVNNSIEIPERRTLRDKVRELDIVDHIKYINRVP